MKKYAEAIAPASIANVCVGYDLLGHAFPTLYDKVFAYRTDRIEKVTLGKVTGLLDCLPVEIEKNTALRAANALLQDQNASFSVLLNIEKNIPLSGGIGGSAASAVAAVVAVNRLLETPLKKKELLKYALEGEIAASGSAHYDNIAPSLLGGLAFISTREIISLPLPDSIGCIVFSPNMTMQTREARAILKSEISKEDCISYAQNLASFITALYEKNIQRMHTCFKDIWIEPQRATLFPYFYPVKKAALEAGAIGCSLSGSGPSMFAWCLKDKIPSISKNMEKAFLNQGYKTNFYSADLTMIGAEEIAA